MPHDPLETVLRLRRRAVDDVRRTLADAITAADAAHEQANLAEHAIETEAMRAADPAGDDLLVEAFGAWLPAARHRAAQARSHHARLEADIARRRAELQASRTALESIEALIASRAAQRHAAETRRFQRAIDEAASRPRTRPAS